MVIVIDIHREEEQGECDALQRIDEQHRYGWVPPDRAISCF